MATYEGAVPAGEVKAGALPAWRVMDLPAPPPYTFRNVMAIIGPGAILLGVSIGSGEWLLGPAAATNYGPAILWITTVSVILQVLLNMEMIRYTMYTGEPIYTGFMRTSPGPTFWGWFYSLLGWLQIGWPGWAASAATGIAAFALGRLPGAGDAGTVLMWGYVTFLLVIVLLFLGRKVERTLELAQWFMVAWIFIYLLFVDIFLVSADTWGKTIGGLFQFGSVPSGADWVLLGAFAAYSGAGGVINGFVTNWFRDKGFGMGSTVGYIPGAIGGEKTELKPTGSVFKPTEKNLANWKAWYRYIDADQYWLWAGGALIGMLLTVTLTVHFVPKGTPVSGMAIAAFQADAMAKVAGQIFWPLTLLNGFWILFSTQLGNSEGYVRMITDIGWTGSATIRRWAKGDVRRVYYTILLAFAIWGCVALNLAQPFLLIQIGANMAGLAFVFLSIHTIVVNRKFLPPELRPSLWREISLVLCALFFLFFVVMLVLYQLFGMKF